MRKTPFSNQFFGHLYLQGNKGLHSVGDCFPINETKGPKSGFTVVKQ